MASRKLNVLVYTGTGASADSVRHCMHSLRQLLTPNYAVTPITEATLLREPWAPTCALLVMPGGADLGYCRALGGHGSRLIGQYVRRGGSYLGLCAGGYYGSARCEFEVGNPALEVVGSRELAFFPGTCRGGAFKGFEYGSEKGAVAAPLVVRREAFANVKAPVDGGGGGGGGGVATENLLDDVRCYVNGGGVFVDAHTMAASGVEVLASYGSKTAVDGGQGSAAVILCKAGSGAALLTGPHPEFAAANLHRQEDLPGYDNLLEDLAAAEEARSGFLRACLVKLGLEANQRAEVIPAFSRMHLSSLNHQQTLRILSDLSDIFSQGDKEQMLIRAEHDAFRLEFAVTGACRTPLMITEKTRHGATVGLPPSDAGKERDSSNDIRRITLHEKEWPSPTETPRFDHALYYSKLVEYRQAAEEVPEAWGNVLLYGEVVTSTNTLLEKNPKLTEKLGTGFTFVATTQVAARGRGSNAWVSPAGSLIMSTVINHPADMAAAKRPIVFIQYLAAVAVIEAIHTYDVDRRYADIPVKLKWPNDIYARDPSKPQSETPSYVKIAGVLANCIYNPATKCYQVVLGIGINTNNNRPTTSLDDLAHALTAHAPPSPTTPLPPFRIEQLVARITTCLEARYGAFLAGGFGGSGIEALYYKHWLHTGQVVSLEAEGGARVKVLGITSDWGMLRVAELGRDGRTTTGRMWTLQSDENSFDFWKGLVRRKV